MKVAQIVNLPFEENSYLMVEEETKSGIVVDPGANADKIIAYFKEKGVELKYIFLTHGHIDHIGAAKEIIEKCDIKEIVCHEMEKDILENAKFNLSVEMGFGDVTLEPTMLVSDNQELEIGSSKFKFIHTPGHTPGSMCIQVDDLLFTGDTLFAGSIGRTDFYGGSYDDMLKSLKLLKTMDDSLNVLSGHGPVSRMGIEKHSNFFMRDI